ncbi:MAG: type II secretion system secretin GspD [Thiohalomonadales bacterium]
MNSNLNKGLMNYMLNFSKRMVLAFVILIGFGITSVTAAEQLTLNFTDTDINAVIGAVSEMTGKNFIVDPRVKGKVTIISNKSMNADDVYQVFLSILKVHGFAAIPGKNVTKIVPEVNAKQDAVPTYTRKRKNVGDEFVTQVVEVKHVNAAQLVPILRPLVPQRGHLAAYPASNILVISDSAANINRLMKIIRRIDQATGDELEIIELKFASSSDIVRVLTQLTRQGAKTAGGTKLKIIADDRTNSIILGGDKTRRLKIRAIIAHLDTEVDIGGSTHVVYLHYANAKDMVKVLTGVSKNIGKKTKGKKVPGSSGPLNKKISILADETTNALVIYASPDEFRTLRKVIKKLDIRRAQILIEGVMADLSMDATNEFGVLWGAAKFDSAGTKIVGGPVAGTQYGIGTGSLAGLAATPPVLGGGLSVVLGSFSGSIKALVRALETDASTNILSTPSILTMDNEEAILTVGRQVPFTTGSYSSTGTGGATNPGNPFQTIEREDVGLTLKITPQVNEGDAIRLEVDQEVSALGAGSLGGQPVTFNRSIKTTVMVEDGQMIALGGLLAEELKENEEKVPLLGDIPVLGWLFKYQTSSKVKKNFMIFLAPKILKDSSEQALVAGAKYNYIRKFQQDIRDDGVNLMNNNESPLLPEFKEFLLLPELYQRSVSGSASEIKSQDNSKIDDASKISIPPELNDVPLKDVNPAEKLMYQQEFNSQRNKELILNGDVF